MGENLKIPGMEALEKIYGENAAHAGERYEALAKMFAEAFDGVPETYFTAPGRTEIIGNHTDHNGGKILAASVTMDMIGAVRVREDHTVTVVSEGFSPVTLTREEQDDPGGIKGTRALLAGILAGAREHGFAVGGFDVCITSEVAAGAGISSSAAFEMLICTIISELFNDGKISNVECAKIGQYAENRYWNKASGLMDQMASVTGGAILLDFSEDVKCTPVPFTFDELGYNLILVQTGEGHADLSEAYSAVPGEMKAVANVFEKERLCEVDALTFRARLPKLRARVGSDRALLRALHFFDECARVDAAAEAIKQGNREEIFRLIRESGDSSYRFLQNVYLPETPKEQPVAFALYVAERYMKQHDAGVVRLHGGGFGGVIMCVVKKETTADFTDYMTTYFGKENVHVLNIRKTGAVKVG